MAAGSIIFIADVPAAILCLTGALCQALLCRRLRVPWALNYPCVICLLAAYAFAREVRMPQMWFLVPPAWHALIPPAIVFWFLCVTLVYICVRFRDAIPPFRRERRTFLRRSTAALCVAPAAVFSAAVITRKNLHIKEVDLWFPDLPEDLHGLRLLQLSDIHMGSFFSATDLARVVDASNQLRPDIAFITGDLITNPWDPLDDCLLQLRRLRATAGVWGCMGNHEAYCGAEAYTQAKARQLGMTFLRSQSVQLPFGSSVLNITGVDYQPFGASYLDGADRLATVTAFNLLLSHNPDVFPIAANKGFDLTLAGHTHGGQINFEILGQNLNVTEFFTPYTKGLYTLPTSSIYVNSGLGTIGIPVRLGAPPEISILRLQRGFAA